MGWMQLAGRSTIPPGSEACHRCNAVAEHSRPVLLEDLQIGFTVTDEQQTWTAGLVLVASLDHWIDWPYRLTRGVRVKRRRRGNQHE